VRFHPRSIDRSCDIDRSVRDRSIDRTRSIRTPPYAPPIDRSKAIASSIVYEAYGAQTPSRRGGRSRTIEFVRSVRSGRSRTIDRSIAYGSVRSVRSFLGRVRSTRSETVADVVELRCTYGISIVHGAIVYDAYGAKPWLGCADDRSCTQHCDEDRRVDRSIDRSRTQRCRSVEETVD
jgi:hypothetical protein